MSAQEIFDEIKRHLRSQEKMPLPTIAEAETLNKHFTRFNCDLDKDIQPARVGTGRKFSDPTQPATGSANFERSASK